MPVKDTSNPISPVLLFQQPRKATGAFPGPKFIRAAVAADDSDDSDDTPLGTLSGTTIDVSATNDGGYLVSHSVIASQLPKNANDKRKEISFNLLSVIDFVGYIITDTFEIGIDIKILGINLGGFYGNAVKGLNVSINLFIISGNVKLYLTDSTVKAKSKDLRLSYSLSSSWLFTAQETDDVLIFSF